MDSVAELEPSEHEIVGQVFGKASPILTWRPASTTRTPAPDAAAAARASDSSILRISRAPTKRMVAWPVVKNIGRERGHALRALFTLVALSLLCGSAIAVGIYVVLGEETASSRAKVLPVRAIASHVGEATIDTLMLAPSAGPVAADPPPPSLAASSPAVAAAPAARPAAPSLASPASPNKRRGHPQGHHDAGSPLHAARSAAVTGAGTRSGHGTT